MGNQRKNWPRTRCRTTPGTRGRVDNHMANFFHCVKTREKPVSPVEIQHRTVSACHLANLAVRLQRKLTWDPQTQQIIGDEEANSWQQRPQRKPYVLEA